MVCLFVYLFMSSFISVALSLFVYVCARVSVCFFVRLYVYVVCLLARLMVWLCGCFVRYSFLSLCV